MIQTGVEGGLEILLDWREGRVSRVGIESTRPLQLPKMFIGRRPEEVLSTLPLIYSVCGVAQGCAAAEALENALSLPVKPSGRAGRRLLVVFETIKEHLWRIEFDWARYCQREPDSNGVVRALGLMKAFRAELFPETDPFLPGAVHEMADSGRISALLDDLEQLLESRIFAQPARDWLQIHDPADLEIWRREPVTLAQQMLARVGEMGMDDLGRSEITPLGIPDSDYLEQRLGGDEADGFIARPDYLGHPAETTPYARRADHPLLQALRKVSGNGLLPRLAARLVELAALSEQLRAAVALLEPADGSAVGRGSAAGSGISWVDAARGALVHRVVLEGGRVSSYQILAPTEWNFHPRGVLAEGLLGLDAASEADLELRAGLLINAIDPCVGYRLRIERPKSRV